MLIINFKRAGCQRKRAGGSTLLNRPTQITAVSIRCIYIVVLFSDSGLARKVCGGIQGI